MDTKAFYNRYWRDEHIKVNSFDAPPGEWSEENFEYHMDLFKPFVGGKLLDYGCGDGQFLNRIYDYCEIACGIDICDLAIEKAHHSYPSLELKLISDHKIPYEDNYFDTACAIDVLEHIVDIESVFEELNRVLKLKGNLLIATNEITRIKIILIALRHLDDYFYPASPHVRYFTRQNLSDILNRKGFEIIEYKKNRTYFGFIPQGQLVVAGKT